MSEESIEDFIEIYDFNKQIWNYSRFKRWFKLTYNFTLTYKRWRGFKKYNKIYIRRTLLHLEKGVKITSQFIQEALSNR